MSTLKKLGPAAFAFLVVTLVPMLAFAADEAGANANTVKAYAAIGAGLAIGLGVLGGTLSPGATARIQTPMILGLALIESLVLLAFVIAFFLNGKV
jgi:F-type H+-transporting ATPase subunit c